jgi:hypothetical protein
VKYLYPWTEARKKEVYPEFEPEIKTFLEKYEKIFVIAFGTIFVPKPSELK